jgi:hypothetical protein
MARNARNLRILDEFYRIGAAGVLGNADVCVIYQKVLIEHNVLEHRAETKRLKDLRFVLGRQIDGLGVAAAFDVEDAFLTPAMLIVANEIAFGSADKVVLPVPDRPNSSDERPVCLSAVAEQCIERIPRSGAK